MAVLGSGQLDDIGVVEGEQPLREVGVASLERVGGEPANMTTPGAVACDGVAQEARGDIDSLFQTGDTVLVDNDGKPYDLDTDEGWEAYLTEWVRVQELPWVQDRRIMSAEDAAAAANDLLWVDTAEGQASTAA